MSFHNVKNSDKPKEKAKWQVPMRTWRGKTKEYYLTEDLEEKFRKMFPIHSNRRLMRWFGISFATVQRFKRELGLVKDKKAIYKELGRDVVRTCEANGYYDFLRNKPVSEACREGFRKRLASGFHPIKTMKEKNPQKYKRWNERRAQAWREKREKEVLRVKYGLKQKTNFRIVLSPMSQSACSQKHSMIVMNNYFSDPQHPDWVCYDNETRRSARREATAVKKGLRVVEGKNDSTE